MFLLGFSILFYTVYSKYWINDPDLLTEIRTNVINYKIEEFITNPFRGSPTPYWEYALYTNHGRFFVRNPDINDLVEETRYVANGSNINITYIDKHVKNKGYRIVNLINEKGVIYSIEDYENNRLEIETTTAILGGAFIFIGLIIYIKSDN